MINFQTRLCDRRSGQVLVESIVAITLVLVGLLGIITLLLRSTVVNREIQNRLIASYLAAEGIELVRYVIDHDLANDVPGGWNATVKPGTYEIDFDAAQTPIPLVLIPYENGTVYLSSGVYEQGLVGDVETDFTRRVRVVDTANKFNVVSEVTWSGRGSFTITVEDEFYNWRRK